MNAADAHRDYLAGQVAYWAARSANTELLRGARLVASDLAELARVALAEHDERHGAPVDVRADLSTLAAVAELLVPTGDDTASDVLVVLEYAAGTLYRRPSTECTAAELDTVSRFLDQLVDVADRLVRAAENGSLTAGRMHDQLTANPNPTSLEGVSA